MSSVNLRNVSDEELIAEMKKRFVIVGGFHYKEWLTIDGIDKYSYEELNHYLDTEAHIDGDEFYQEHREALLEKFGDEREPDDELLETKCGCQIIINSREHDECRCDGDGENWICADCYDGEYDESDDEDVEPNKCDVCCEECVDKWCEECKLNVWECKYCGDKLNNEIKKCCCNGEDNENKLMVELRALLDKRYVIKQERYNNWSNSITIYAEFSCAVYSKKPNDKFGGYWNCGKCDCHYPCGISKAFKDLISKYGYRHEVIDCSCVSGLWKNK